MSRRSATALALLALCGRLGVARAGTAVGPELDVGTSTLGPTNALPVPVLARDAQGTLMLFKDVRVPYASEAALYAQRFDDAGGLLGPERLIAWGVANSALVETGDRVLVLWTGAPAPKTGAVIQSAFIDADGAAIDEAPVTGLGVFPTSASCRAGSCTLSNGGSFVRLDLETRAVQSSFDVASVESVAPGELTIAPHGDGSLAVRTGSNGSPILLSALLAADDSVVRPFTRFPFDVSAPAWPVLVAGDGGYLLGVSDTSAPGRLVLALLGEDGGLLNSMSERPLQSSQSWAAAYAAGGYRVLSSGQPPQFSVLTEQGASAPAAVPLVPDGSVASIVSLRPNGTGLLATFQRSDASSALGEPPLPQVARLTLDGAVESLGAVGQRRSQAFVPSLAANGGRYLLTYQEYADQDASIIHYSLLDANGAELGRGGTLAGDLPGSLPPQGAWSSAPADGGFLISSGDKLWLADADANLTPVPLALPGSSTRTSFIPCSGGGIILVVAQNGGGCGEDCGWWDVSAQRFARDGSALDAAPLFGSLRDFASDRTSPGAVWDGSEFVVFSVEAFGQGLSFRRVGADGALVDADWQSVAGSANAVTYAVAVGRGELLVAFATTKGVFASRVLADGTSDPAPVMLDATAPDTVGFTLAPLGVSYDGSEFVVAWQKSSALVAARVTGEGLAGSVDVLTDSREPPPHGLALASAGEGRTLLGYYRFDEQSNVLTSRIKLRSLTSGPAAPGSACALGGDCESGFCSSGVCCETACSDPAESCSDTQTGLAAGICAPIADAGGIGAGGAPEGCDEHTCPAGFTCDEVALVCVVPARPSAVPPTHTGCSCRTGREPAPSAWFMLLAIAGLGLRRKRARARSS